MSNKNNNSTNLTASAASAPAPSIMTFSNVKLYELDKPETVNYFSRKFSEIKTATMVAIQFAAGPHPVSLMPHVVITTLADSEKENGEFKPIHRFGIVLSKMDEEDEGKLVYYPISQCILHNTSTGFKKKVNFDKMRNVQTILNKYVSRLYDDPSAALIYNSITEYVRPDKDEDED